jgi:DnaK suppressor protein
MDSHQKKLIREKITEAITTTERDIVSLKELTKPVEPDVSIGRLTRMEAIGSKSINEAALNLAMTKLAKLKFALANIDKPDFGICMECGEPIPIGRIMIMPESHLCVHCAD